LGNYSKVISLEEFNKIRGSLGKIVCASGGFDPLHKGHTSYIIESKKYGDTLVVIVNGDNFLKSKRGKSFMNLSDRATMISCIRGVDYVIPFEIENDLTVNEALKIIRPHIFTKGGDRKSEINIPELNTCKELNIKIEMNVGNYPEIHSTDILHQWELFIVEKKQINQNEIDMEKYKIFLEEYKLTEKFVIHYEKLIWYIGSILNGSVLVLSGLVFKEGNIKNFGGIIILSIFISFLWYRFECRYRKINLLKLNRMQEIERMFGFRQSLIIKEYDEKAKPFFTAHRLIIMTCIIVPLSLFMIWFSNL